MADQELKKRILVTEDEEIVRYTLCTILNRLGYETLEASHGGVALETLKNEKVDMILVDLMMPEIDGFQVISHVSKTYPEIPIIAVSGLNDVQEVVKAIRQGAWDYILKPVSKLDIFQHSLERSFERAQLLRDNRLQREHLMKVNQELSDVITKLEEDEKSGRRIQFQLLPLEIQMFGNYEFSRHLIPSTFLSGDFLDYFAIDDTHIGFYIADVSGHGVSSAFVTVLLKSFMSRQLREYFDEGDRTIFSPSKILQELNAEILYQNIDKFLTIFFGVIDTEQHTMLCANGGQYPFPIIYNGKSKFIPQKSFPIGVFDFTQYEEIEIPLSDEFALYLVSDGILDLLDYPTPHEKNNYLLAQMNSLDLTLDELVKKFDFTSEHVPDDITFLKVRKYPGK